MASKGGQGQGQELGATVLTDGLQQAGKRVGAERVDAARVGVPSPAARWDLGRDDGFAHGARDGMVGEIGGEEGGRESGHRENGAPE